MDRKQFGVIGRTIQSYYPTAKHFKSDGDRELWFDALKDIPFEEAMTALQQHAKISPDPPTIADLRHNGNADWAIAWEQVQEALKEYNHYERGSIQKVYAKLDAVTARAVRCYGVKTMIESDKTTVMAQFRDIYKQMVKQEESEKMKLIGGAK